MNRNIVPSWAESAALVCSLLATVGTTQAEACPSIDYWLELVRERGGQHRLLDATELARQIEKLEGSVAAQRHSWTSGIMAAFPDGSGLLLLNENTNVCGIIEIPPNRQMPVRRSVSLRSS